MKKSRSLLTIIVLVLLIAGVLTGWFFTMDAGVALTQRIEQRIARNKGASNGTTTGPSQTLVDESPLKTAQNLAHQTGATSTVEEKHYADRAVQLADHEVDASYATALREASHQAKAMTTPQRELNERIQKLGTQIRDDQQRLDALTKTLNAQGSGNLSNLTDEQQLAIATAQTNLENDQNDLEDAKLQWLRVGGDATGKIERMKAEHDSMFHRATPVPAGENSGQTPASPGANPVASSTPSDHQAVAEVGAQATEPTSLLWQLHDWNQLQDLKGQIL